MLLLFTIPIFSLLFDGTSSQETLDNPRCNHWMDPGECNTEFTIKWYYDRYDHRCRRYYYGGCGGNDNRFDTLEECSSTCHFVEPTARDRCSLPHDAGNCESDIERWFFDWNKKQCVCSWWTGCGGNSNRYYSYNHCMEICGEWAEHGPGIDEEYWGKRNGTSSMSMESQSVFQNYAPLPLPEDLQYRQNQNIQTPSYQLPDSVRSDDLFSRASQALENTEDEEVGGANVQSVEQPPSAVDQRMPAISWSEFNGYANGNYAELRTREDTVITNGKWENITKAHGHSIYKFDSGAQSHVSPDGATTTNRQVLVIMEDRAPRVAFTQNLPAEVSFSRVAPPPPFSTMFSPIARRNKKIRKQKIPPRLIQQPIQQFPEPTFMHTYNTDSKGNRISSSSSLRKMIPLSPERRYNNQRAALANAYPEAVVSTGPLPTQIYATYNTNRFGRRTSHQKVTWTGHGPMPIAALPREFQHLAPPTIQRTPARPPVQPSYSRPTLSYPTRQPSVPVRPTSTPRTPVSAPHPTIPRPTRPEPTRARATPPAQPTFAYTRAPPTRPPYQNNRPTPPAYIRPTTPAVALPRPTPRDQRTIIPTVILPTVPQTERVLDVTTRFPATVASTTIPPTSRTVAEAIEYSRPQVERVTPMADLSMDDIIAMGDEVYEYEYEAPMDEPEQEEPGTTSAPVRHPQTVRQSQRPAPPTRQVPTARPAPPQWQAIVMPPTVATEDDVEFEITSYGDYVKK